MRTEYGIPVPAGVKKDWEANSMGREGAGSVLRKYHTPLEWGDPENCVAWFDRFERLRTVVGHYPNGRSVIVRINANGKWSAAFGRAAKAIEARSDATPKSGAARQGESAVASAICPTSSSIGDKL